jgi:formiminotetrahydrofolate cyclodeaminase
MVNIGTRWRVPKKDRKAWDAFMGKVLKAPGINDSYKAITRQKAQAALKKGRT